MNLGASALRATGLDARTIAGMIGVQAQTILSWFSGARKPLPQYRARIQEHYPAVLFDLWDQADIRLIPPPPAHAHAQPEEGDDLSFNLDHTAPDAVLAALNEQCNRLRADVARARTSPFKTEPKAVMQAEKAYSEACEKLAKAAGQLRAVEEHRLTKSLTFTTLKKRVVDALAQYPEARDAVIDALKDDQR